MSYLSFAPLNPPKGSADNRTGCVLEEGPFVQVENGLMGEDGGGWGGAAI